MSEELGRVAYEAHQRSMGVDVETAASYWRTLNARNRAFWIAAASAVEEVVAARCQPLVSAVESTLRVADEEKERKPNWRTPTRLCLSLSHLDATLTALCPAVEGASE